MKELTKEEKELIVSALLFTACTDVVNDFDEDAQNKMVDIAIKMDADPTMETELFGTIFDQPDIAKKIINSFAIKRA